MSAESLRRRGATHAPCQRSAPLVADPDKARQVVARFRRPDMCSVRIPRPLSAHHPAYNPFSCSLGSVWPHDNGIIAEGFKRYGFADDTSLVALDFFVATSYVLGYRLPEFYAGLPASRERFSVQYGSANIPQAWAA